jgi:hypothetical protein
MIFDASLAPRVLRETLGHILEDPKNFLPIYAISTLSGIGFDVFGQNSPALLLGYNVAFLFLTLVLQAWATLAIVQCADVQSPQPRRLRIASLFGISLVTGLGIAFGLLLLILPGLYFAGRWFLTVPILLGENLSMSEAMQESWDRTERHWLGCALLIVLAALFQMLPLVGGLYVPVTGDIANWAWIICLNLASQAGWLFGVAAAATYYLSIGDRRATAAKIFG